MRTMLAALSDEPSENRYPVTGFLQDMVNIAASEPVGFRNQVR